MPKLSPTVLAQAFAELTPAERTDFRNRIKPKAAVKPKAKAAAPKAGTVKASPKKATVAKPKPKAKAK